MAEKKRYYEVVLSVKLKADSTDDALAQGTRLAKGLSEKLGPTECQCVWRVRDEEVREK